MLIKSKTPKPSKANSKIHDFFSKSRPIKKQQLHSSPLSKKLEKYKKSNNLHNQIIEFEHADLHNLKSLVTQIFQNRVFLEASFDSLRPDEVNLLRAFLSRKKLVSRLCKRRLDYAQILTCIREYKSQMNSDDKLRLVFKSFDKWVKQKSANVCTGTNKTRGNHTRKHNKLRRHRRMYGSLFKREWVDDSINQWGTGKQKEPVFLVPVDINKVQEKGVYLGLFGENFFASAESTDKMKMFLDRSGPRESIFMSFLRKSIEDKLDKKFEKLTEILKQIRTQDQWKGIQWFQDDVEKNAKGKLPIIILDAIQAETHFRDVYKKQLQ